MLSLIPFRLRLSNWVDDVRQLASHVFDHNPELAALVTACSNDFVNAHQVGDPFGSKTTVFLSAFRFPFLLTSK